MTHTTKFIENAIEGGWREGLLSMPNAYYEIDSLTRIQGDTVGVWFYRTELNSIKKVSKVRVEILIAEILLDPSAWRAVGTVRGWGEAGDYPDRVYEAYDTFFHEVYNGRSIEEALEAISK